MQTNIYSFSLGKLSTAFACFLVFYIVSVVFNDESLGEVVEIYNQVGLGFLKISTCLVSASVVYVSVYFFISVKAPAKLGSFKKFMFSSDIAINLVTIVMIFYVLQNLFPAHQHA